MLYADFQNGIGASAQDTNGYDTIVGLDVHSNPGVITCSKALTKASSTTVTNLCTCSCTLPNGDSFFGDNSHNIYKVTSAGVVSLVHTITSEVAGLGYFNGYLYYANSSNNLGRIAEANASSEATWSSHNNTWAAFTNSGGYRHMVVHNLSLFITNKQYIAAIDSAGTFTANALDLESNQNITCLAKERNALLIGTSAGTANNQAGLFLWDTYSSSWTLEDLIDEKSVNCFIPADNAIYISLGTDGNIYQWDGSRAVFDRKLRDGETSVTTYQGSIYGNPYGSANLNGIPLFATDRGVVSLGRASNRFPVANVIQYVASGGQGTYIGALVAVGNQLFAAYYGNGTYGIDKISDNYYSGWIITPVQAGKISNVNVRYKKIETGTSIDIGIDSDASGTFTDYTPIKDENRGLYYIDGGVGNKNLSQTKVTLNASTTYKPTILSIEVT